MPTYFFPEADGPPCIPKNAWHECLVIREQVFEHSRERGRANKEEYRKREDKSGFTESPAKPRKKGIHSVLT